MKKVIYLQEGKGPDERKQYTYGLMKESNISTGREKPRWKKAICLQEGKGPDDRKQYINRKEKALMKESNISTGRKKQQPFDLFFQKNNQYSVHVDFAKKLFPLQV